MDGRSDQVKLTIGTATKDESGAGTTFSGKELNIAAVSEYENLAVTVGELILPGIKGLDIKKMEKTDCVFDVTRHTVLPSGTRKTAVVVAFMYGQRLNLYALVSKKDGLCTPAQLPRTLSGLAGYSEWTEGLKSASTRERNTYCR